MNTCCTKAVCPDCGERIVQVVGSHDEAPDPRHPATVAFLTALDELEQLHERKQRDYGSDSDPFANVRASAEFGVPAWVGAMIRLNDKVKRLQRYAERGSLANEGAIDSFNDIAVYAIIARVLFEEEMRDPEPPKQPVEVDEGLIDRLKEARDAGKTAGDFLLHLP